MLVGREQELTVLNNQYSEMLSGKGSILFVTGEAGLGKTTLIHEWHHSLPPESVVYAEAACSIPIGNVDVGTLEALQPWADVIAQLQAHAGEGKKKFDLKKLVRDAAPSWAWAIPFVGDIAHAAVETGRLIKEQRGENNPNAENQQQVFQQYVNLLTKVSEQAPLVILLDDMHWADASSTNLLFYLSRQIADKKIFVIVTYRPIDAVATNDGKGHPILTVKNEILRYSTGKELALGYLGNTAIRELLMAMFPEYHVDDKFEQWLRKISDGNSLFVTQFIKTLREDGHLNVHGAFGGQYGDISIPLSALAVVEERTRRLDKPTKKLLSYATAEGEEFTSYVLSQLAQKRPLEILDELKEAQRLGMIQGKGQSRAFANQTTSVFGFSHALFHQALYDTLMPEEREILHKQCFEILKTEWDRLGNKGERTMSLASKLLTHAEKSGEYETAAGIALEAANGAWKTYAEAEAMEMLAHVHRLTETAAPAAETFKKVLAESSLLRMEIETIRGHYPQAYDAANTAFTLFSELKDDTHIAKALLGKAYLLRAQSDYERSKVYALDALKYAEKSGDAETISSAYNVIGNVYNRRGMQHQSLEYYEKSLAIAETIGGRSLANVLNNIGIVYNDLSRYEEALAIQARSLGIAETCNDRVSVARSLTNMGLALNDLGRYKEALEHFERSLAINEALGNMYGLSAVFSNMGILHRHLGDYENALKYYKRSVTLQESLGDKMGQARVLGNIGIVYSQLGNDDEALQYFFNSLKISESIDDPGVMAVVTSNVGAIYSKRGLYDDALKYLKKSVEAAEFFGDRSNIAFARHNLGVNYRRHGDIALASVEFDRALAIADEVKSDIIRGETYCQMGLLHELEAGQHSDGSRATLMQQAVAMMEKGISVLRGINYPNVKEYDEELKRMQKTLG